MFLKIFSIIGSLTFLSRLLGYFRDFFIAKLLGAGLVSDAFFVSFKLPNLFRRLFAEGSLNSAFIPILTGIKEKKGKIEASKFLSEIFSLTLIILLLLVIIFEILMPLIISFIAPGFRENPDKYELTINLSRLTFPFLLFICLSSLIGGFLNTIGKFAAMAFIPVILNLSMLSVLFFFSVNYDSKQMISIFLSASISIAGIIQLVWLFINLKKNHVNLYIKFRNLFKISPDIKKLIILFLPAVIGNGVYQLNLVIDMVLASTLVNGSISFLYFADRVTQLPLGVIGIALSTALLPILSTQIKKSNLRKANLIINNCLQIGIIFVTPCVVGILILSSQIVDFLFVRGEFSVDNGLSTSYALTAFSLGLPAFILVKIFAVNFFAREDTRTPVKVALVAVLINIILNLILIKYYAHVGLAIATSISAWANCFLLFFILKKEHLIKINANTIQVFIKCVFSSLLMGLFIIIFKNFFIKFSFHDLFVIKFSKLLGIILLSFVLYITMLYLFKLSHLLKFNFGGKN